MRGTLSHHVQLALEVSSIVHLVKVRLWFPSISVGGLQYHKGLQNDGLSRQSCRTQKSRVPGDHPPSQYSQIQLVCDILEHCLRIIENLGIRLEEQVSRGVLAECRQLVA